MTEIGKEVVRTMEIIPAQTIVREDIYYTYACKRCSESADEGCETPVVKAPREKNIIPGSFATPEAIAHIMTQKFVMGSPLCQQFQLMFCQSILRSFILLYFVVISNCVAVFASINIISGFFQFSAAHFAMWQRYQLHFHAITPFHV